MCLHACVCVCVREREREREREIKLSAGSLVEDRGLENS